MLVGDGKWRINDAGGKLPSFFMADGPSGLRKKLENKKIADAFPSGNDIDTVPATVMPSLSTVSYTWDPELAYLDGKTIADECVENGPFEILVGASSRDIRLSAKIDVNLPYEEQFSMPY